MEANDPPPDELPADPIAARNLLNTVNVPILKQWCKYFGLTLKKNVKRAGVLKVLIAYYDQARDEAAAVPSDSGGESCADEGDESSDKDAVDIEVVETEVSDVDEVVVPPEFVEVVCATQEKFVDTDIKPVLFALQLFTQKKEASVSNNKFRSIPVLEGKKVIADIQCPVNIRCQLKVNFKKDFYPTKARLTNLMAMTNGAVASVGDFVDSSVIKDIEELIKKKG
jgi:hypothetical protein